MPPGCTSLCRLAQAMTRRSSHNCCPRPCCSFRALGALAITMPKTLATKTSCWAARCFATPRRRSWIGDRVAKEHGRDWGPGALGLSETQPAPGGHSIDQKQDEYEVGEVEQHARDEGDTVGQEQVEQFPGKPASKGHSGHRGHEHGGNAPGGFVRRVEVPDGDGVGWYDAAEA